MSVLAVPLGGITLALLLTLTGSRTLAASPEEIAQAVQQLGDAKFTVREKASQFLWNAGKAAEPALREALKSNDAEVVRRAREILDRFKWGLFPDTPENIVRIIGEYRSGDPQAKRNAVRKLLDLDQAGFAVLARFLAAEENAEDRTFLATQISEGIGKVAGGLIGEGNYTAAEELLDLGLAAGTDSAIQSYVALQLGRGQLDASIARFRELAEKQSDLRAAEVLAHLYRAKGDLARARLAAEKSGKADVLNLILYEQGDWKTLARRPIQMPGMRTAVEIGLGMGYHYLAGNGDDFARTVTAMRKHAEAEAGDEIEVRLAGQYLFLVDRPDDALALLTSPKTTRYFAFEILCAQLRFRDAFALLERARKDNDPDLFRLEVRHAQALYYLGETDKALALFTELGEAPRARYKTYYTDLLKVEDKLGLKALAREHCGRYLSQLPEGETAAKVLENLFPKKADLAEAWWKYLLRKENPRTAMVRVGDLLDGKVPPEEVAALLTEAEREAGPDGPQRTRWLHALGEVALAAGLKERAEKYLANSGSAPALVLLGDQLAKKQQWREAAQRYGEAWQKDRTQPMPLYLRGWALVQAGQAEEGQQLIDRAHCLPLAQDKVRHDFMVDLLRERDHLEAARHARDLLLRLAGHRYFYLVNATSMLARDSMIDRDYLRSADLFERCLLGCIRMNAAYLENPPYVLVPLLIHRLRARGLLQAGKVEEARKEMALCQERLPGDVYQPIDLLPGLEKHALKAEADELFKRVRAVHEELCKEYPRSPMAHNRLAWLLVRCGRDLDAALEHARKADEVVPNRPGYLGTLAEVHFQRGEQAEAIALMKRCIELDRKNRFFPRQLQRFAAGDRSAPLPEIIE